MTGRRARLGAHAADVAGGVHVTLLLAVVTGVLTGVVVAGFERLVQPALDWVLDGALIVVILVPAVGLLVVNVVSANWGDRDTATTDAYVRAYHERGGGLGVRAAIRKLVMSAISLGTGSALGFEGPALLAGSTIGSTIDRRFLGRFRQDDAKVLMVAGAAAGVAAIFKAPLTGVVFALEVPYRGDLARRALPAALAAAGSAYVTYVLIVGTAPLFATGGAASFDLTDLGASLVLGLVCGVLARAGSWAIGHAKHISLPRVQRVALAVAGLSVAAVVTNWWFDAPFHLGPSYEVIDYVRSGDHGVALLVGLFVVRAAATWLSVEGGGVGGLFIPLVTNGAIVGGMVQHLAPASNSALFPTIGIAAFLGAGYRTPLAGVAFVAEATGQPFFLVPALLAAAAAQVVMGRWSFSPFQRGERAPDIEPLTRLTLFDIMSPNPDTVDAAATLQVAVQEMLAGNRRWAPVTHDGAYVGLLAVTDIAAVPQAAWSTTTVDAVARRDVPAAAPDDAVSAIGERMRAHDGPAAIAVVAEGSVVGIVTSRDLSNVEVLLDRLTAGEDTR